MWKCFRSTAAIVRLGGAGVNDAAELVVNLAFHAAHTPV